jgi:hypothetical protein
MAFRPSDIDTLRQCKDGALDQGAKIWFVKIVREQQSGM